MIKKLLVLAFVVALGIWLFTDVVLKMLVERELKALEEDSGALYSITYDKLDIKLFSGKIELENLRLDYKTSLYDSLKATGNLPIYTYALHVAHVDAKARGWRKLVFQHELGVQHIVLGSPSVIRYRQMDGKEVEEASIPDSLSSNTFSEWITQLQLDSIKIKNASIAQINVDKDSVEAFSIHELNFTLNNLVLGMDELSDGGYRSLPIFEWEMKELHLRLSETNHMYFDKVMVMPKENRLKLTGVKISNTRPYKEFLVEQKWRKAHLEMEVDSISIDISFIEEFIFLDRLHIPSIEISVMHLHLATNTHKDFKVPDRPLVSKRIRDIKTPLLIDTIKIVQSEIDVHLLLKEDRDLGYLSLDRLTILVTNLTNMPKAWENNRKMTIAAVGRNMKQGYFDVHMEFDLKNKNDNFSAKGKLSGLDFKNLNSITEKPTILSFEDGRLHHVTFDIYGNNDSAFGVVHFDYQDLKIQLLKAEDVLKNGFGLKVLSRILNGVVKSSNMVDAKNYKYAVVSIEKPMNKGHIGYIMNVVSDGVVEIVSRGGERDDKKKKEKKLWPFGKKKEKDN